MSSSPTIVIVPYDPAWPDDFAALATAIRAAMDDLALRVDHIGSTSVPGLAAKDIIDIQITVADLTDDAIRDHLATLGYTEHPTIAGDHIPPGLSAADADPARWRKRYFRAPEGMRPMHLHVRQAGLPNQRYPILFRDYLRATPMAAGAYRQIKEALARLHPDDVEAYYDVKDPVCDLIIDAAERWAIQTSWTSDVSSR
ncbi:MAG: GrpB family protein [Thermomicrobiales bacterium]